MYTSSNGLAHFMLKIICSYGWWYIAPMEKGNPAISKT